MRAYLTKRYKFSAAHRLHCDELSPEQNRNVYGKCNNPHGHGHNYIIAVTVAGQVDGTTGMVCNLSDLDGFVHPQVVERYEHQNLNALPEFGEMVPTTENLCVAIYNILKKGFRAAELVKVRIEETSNNAFEYSGGAELLN